MSDTPSATATSRSLTGGRLLALMGIILVALGLRDAATAVSPILTSIEKDVPFHDIGIGVLAMMAPFAFAVVGSLTPALARRLGLEWSTILASLLIGAGEIARSLTQDSTWFIACSFVSLAGTGSANVLLPPLVKKYFPDRIRSVSTFYLFAAVMGSVIPAYAAAPLAVATDWRFSVAAWGFIALAAVLPWLLQALVGRPSSGTGLSTPARDARVTRLVWTSSTSWALATSFAIASFNCYIMWGWLPIYLHERLGMSEAESGIMLGLYTAMAIPSALLGPTLIARMTSMVPLAVWGICVIGIGALGLWFIPGTVTWLWVALSGFGVIFFNLTLVLINLRTSTPVGSVTLSGMSQGVGYLVGATGPLIVGLIHHTTHDWGLVFAMIVGSALVGIFPLVVLRRRVLTDVER